MASLSPERSDRLPDRNIGARSVGIHEASVSKLALGRGIDAVYLGVSERLELLSFELAARLPGALDPDVMYHHAKLLRQTVYTRVLQ